MPTPSGMLKKGDVIENTHDGSQWRVIERLGTDELYSVRMVPLNRQLKLNDRARGYAILTEVKYHLKHGWRVI